MCSKLLRHKAATTAGTSIEAPVQTPVIIQYAAAAYGTNLSLITRCVPFGGKYRLLGATGRHWMSESFRGNSIYSDAQADFGVKACWGHAGRIN